MKNSVIVSMLRKLICCEFLLLVELTTTACLIIFIASETSGKYSPNEASSKQLYLIASILLIGKSDFRSLAAVLQLPPGQPRTRKQLNRGRKWLTVNRFKQYKINLIQDGSKKSQFIVNIYSFCTFEKRNIISNGFISFIDKLTDVRKWQIEK